MCGEGVIVKCGGIRVECEVVGLEVDDGLAAAREDAVHEPVGLDGQREFVHARLNVKSLRIVRRARERERPVGRREDYRPHLVLELVTPHSQQSCTSKRGRGKKARTSWKSFGAPTGSAGVAFLGWGRAHMTSWSFAMAGGVPVLNCVAKKFVRLRKPVLRRQGRPLRGRMMNKTYPRG